MGFQIGFPALRNYPSSGVTYDPNVQTWMDARVAEGDPVGTAYANAVNQYVLDLKAISGHWDTITQLVVFAGATTVAGGLVPIKGLTPTHSNLVAGDFALKTGVKGNAANKYIDTGYTHTSFGQDDMHTYCLVTEASSANTHALFGNGGASNGAWSIVWNNATRCRGTTAQTFSSTATGGYGLNRSISSSYQRMLADTVGTQVNSSTTTNASPYYLLARSGNGSTTPVAFSNARILVWAIGPASTLANYTTPGNDLQTALNAIP
jgi:hypothetical protein